MAIVLGMLYISKVAFERGYEINYRQTGNRIVTSNLYSPLLLTAPFNNMRTLK